MTSIIQVSIVKDLALVISKTLGLEPGDNVTVQRDRLNPLRVMVIREPVK